MTQEQLNDQTLLRQQSTIGMKVTPRFLIAIFFFFTIGVALYSWLVWPTPYYIVHDSDYGFIRVNRFTGVSQRATDHGWMTEEQFEAYTKAKLAAKSTPTPSGRSDVDDFDKYVTPKPKPSATLDPDLIRAAYGDNVEPDKSKPNRTGKPTPTIAKPRPSGTP